MLIVVAFWTIVFACGIAEGLAPFQARPTLNRGSLAEARRRMRTR